MPFDCPLSRKLLLRAGGGPMAGLRGSSVMDYITSTAIRYLLFPADSLVSVPLQFRHVCTKGCAGHRWHRWPRSTNCSHVGS